MASLTVRLDRRDQLALIDAVAARILDELRPLLKTEPGPGQGIRILSVAETARRMEISESTLRRLELADQVPRRRKLTLRRRVYFEHELDDLPADRVRVKDNRTLNLTELAQKLGVDEKTIQRMVKANEILAPVEGRWFEREIDEWLLARPKA